MITIQDNDYLGKVYPLSEVEELLYIANKPIKQLCEEENLLIYPLDIEDSNDKIGENSIVSIYANEGSSVRIKTGNIMGFIGRNNQYLKIYSRFDNDQNDFFMHYMLQKVFSYNIFNLDFMSTEENILKILVLMFPSMLKTAMKQGIYKEYRKVQYNDSNVRGTIDISRHIRENIPFCGNISYDTEEFCYDNAVMELIRHTIEYIRTIPLGDMILSSNEVVEECVSKVISYTPCYRHSDRLKIIHENLRPCRHPYYTGYNALQKICIQILNQEDMKYGDGDGSVSGILFDGAWLWEEYLNTLLCDYDFNHPQNKQGTGAIYLFEHGGKRYPDFWKKDFVLDAKYKKYAQSGNKLDIAIDDINQIVTYMFRLKSQKSGIICPLIGEKNKTISERMNKNGYKGVMYIYALAIPQNCKSYDDFANKMGKNENQLIKEIMDS